MPESQAKALGFLPIRPTKGRKSRPPLEPPLERLRHTGPKRQLTEIELAAGVKRAPGHEASWEHRRGGETIDSGGVKSGLEGSGKVPMGKEQVRIHTEGKVVDIARQKSQAGDLQPGDRFYIDGVRGPCKPLCQPEMRKGAVEMKIWFVYRAGGETWTFSPFGGVTRRYRGRTQVVR